MPDYALLRFVEQGPDGETPSREIGLLRLPAFRGPDVYHFLLHLRRIITKHGLHPVSWTGGVRHDPKNTNGLTGSGDVWDLVVTLTPEPEVEEAGGSVESVLVQEVLADVYARFIMVTADAAVGEARARRSAVAQLEHDDGWQRQDLQEISVSPQPQGGWLFEFRHAGGAVAYVPVSPQGQARGRVRTAEIRRAAPAVSAS